MRASIKLYEPGYLPAVIGLLQASGDEQALERLLPVLSEKSTFVVVAEADGKLVGLAAGAVVASTAWVSGVFGPDDETVERLVEALEATLAEQGAARIFVVAGNGATLDGRGYERVEAALFERAISKVGSQSSLERLGGRTIDTRVWDDLRGMDEAKEIIERRVILPLAEPDLARRHGVAQPKAIVLFGPPGTGKTTFAKGIAGRLGWPFIEVAPAEIGAEGAERQAKLLVETFDQVLAVTAAVVFVDEVEDLASVRSEDRRVNPSVTNEFMKQIPRMRDAPHHLLACATNWVSRLDPAFLRPGRFDYVLPVGPPGADARRAIWLRYISEITDEQVDVDALVAATELFTPADIEWAARTAAQRAFEREHFDAVGHRAKTEDFMAAVENAKPTLTPEMIETFRDETERFARA